MNPSIRHVRRFWEESPLWTGESAHPPGSKGFFDEHHEVYIRDCFAGRFDPRTLPTPGQRERVLDLGCGPGFWTIELGRQGCEELVAADLTYNALQLTAERCRLYDVPVSLSQQDAEHLALADNSFSHVNCQGVIHHTPNTEAAVREIHRVLRPGGTACISVYYRNALLRLWPYVAWIGPLLTRIGGGLKGRGRETLFQERDVDEIVRHYDGAGNPIGKAYSKKSFIDLVEPQFEVEESFLHFFPARALPLPVPAIAHCVLDRRLGFMIYARLKKR